MVKIKYFVSYKTKRGETRSFHKSNLKETKELYGKISNNPQEDLLPGTLEIRICCKLS